MPKRYTSEDTEWLSGVCNACHQAKRVMRLRPSKLAFQFPLICMLCYDKQAHGLPIGPAAVLPPAPSKLPAVPAAPKPRPETDLDRAMPVIPILNALQHFGLADPISFDTASLAEQNYGQAWFCSACGICQPTWLSATNFQFCIRCDQLARRADTQQRILRFRNT